MDSQATREQAQLLTTDEVADLLRIAPATLVDWRNQRRGPRWFLMGRQVRYKLPDVLKWQQQALEPVEPKGL